MSKTVTDSVAKLAAMTKKDDAHNIISNSYPSKVLKSSNGVHHNHSPPPSSTFDSQQKEFLAKEREERTQISCKLPCNCSLNFWTATWLLFSTTTVLGRCRNSNNLSRCPMKSEEGGERRIASSGLHLLLLLSLAFAAACAFNQVVPAVHCASALGLAGLATAPAAASSSSGTAGALGLGGLFHQSSSTSFNHGRTGHGHLSRPQQVPVDIEEEAAALIKVGLLFCFIYLFSY